MMSGVTQKSCKYSHLDRPDTDFLKPESLIIVQEKRCLGSCCTNTLLGLPTCILTFPSPTCVVQLSTFFLLLFQFSQCLHSLQVIKLPLLLSSSTIIVSDISGRTNGKSLVRGVLIHSTKEVTSMTLSLFSKH